MEENDNIENLYQGFRNEVLSGEQLLAYDSDELCEIFDLAGDYQDYFTQLHALMLGKKLYPDDEQLELRSGFFLNDTGDDKALAYFLERNKTRKGVIMDILRLRNRPLTPARRAAELDAFVDANRFEDDEDIIQFVNLIVDTQQVDWLSRNYKKFLDRCRYRDTALVETGHALAQDYPEVAITLFDEVAAINPFNIEAWEKMAELNGRRGAAQDGLSDIEYALAINPDDEQALTLKACLLMQNDTTNREAETMLLDMHAKNPEWLLPVNNLSMIYEATGDYDKVLDLWEPFVDRPEMSGAVTEHLMECDRSGECDARVDAMFMRVASYRDDESLLGQRVDWFVANGRHSRALDLMKQYDAESGVYDNAYSYINLLYRFGLISQVVEYVENDRPGDKELKLTPPALAMYVASMLRIGRFDDVIEATADYLAKSDNADNLDFRINFSGFRNILRHIRKLARQRVSRPDTDPIAEAISES